MRPPVSRDPLPLTGVRVAVTRPVHAEAELAQALRAAGAAPVSIPLTCIVPPLDDAPLRDAAERVAQYDWIVFTSANAVRALAGAVGSNAAAVRARIAVVGSATAAAARELLLREPDVVPATFSSAALVPAILDTTALRAAHVLWPRAEAADDRLALAFESAGALLDAPVAYRSECAANAARELVRLEQQGGIDAITFTAPSAIACYGAAMAGETRCVVAVLGSTTAGAARTLGIPVHVQPEQPIISALVAALARHYMEASG